MPTVTVVGSVNLDLVATCRRLPRPGETVIAHGWDRHPGGKGANQALAARRAGADTALVACVGQDAAADEALSILAADGVDLSRVQRVPAPTGIAVIMVGEGGENQIVVVPGANAMVDPASIGTGGADAVLCQLEIPIDAVEAAAAAATGLFCLNAAPAAPLPDTIKQRVDVVIVNETERDELAGDLAKLQALVVVTLGAAGAKAYRSGRLVAETQPPRVDPIDTVGAGDAFCGTMVAALAAGATVAAALERACAAGALATTRAGAQPSLPTAEEIDAIMHR